MLPVYATWKQICMFLENLTIENAHKEHKQQEVSLTINNQKWLEK